MPQVQIEQDTNKQTKRKKKHKFKHTTLIHIG